MPTFRPERLRLIALFGLAAFLAATGSAGAASAFSTLYDFLGGSDGGLPKAGLILDPNSFFEPPGALYGTTAQGGNSGCGADGSCGTVFMVFPPATAGGAWGETVLYRFKGGKNDGGTPVAGLTTDASGTLYGTTLGGGASGQGTVFALTRPNISGGPWTESVLYSFSGGNDGAQPAGKLVFDSSGALYGTTSDGGGSGCGGAGCGIVFKLTPPTSQGGAWTETVLYSFTGAIDGGTPLAGLILDASGTLYGTTSSGGVSVCGVIVGCGTVFKLTPPTVSGGAWTETVLYSFSGSGDGGNPSADLIFNPSGGVFGTTQGGGLSGCGISGCGTVFELMASENDRVFNVLYSFTGGIGGDGPSLAGLAIDNSGALYGTTSGNGVSACAGAGCGAVFKLTPQGGGVFTKSTLYSFTGGSDGGVPQATLTLDAAGNLYGTTSVDGAPGCNGTGCGTVFELASAAAPAPPLAAAVLPASRSVQIGATPTAFATIINPGTATAHECAIAAVGGLPLNFVYQTTNPSTNALTGTANTPADIQPGASQSFVVALTPTAIFPPTDIAFSFACADANPASSIVGVNTLNLSASTNPVPDIVALAASGDPGYVDIPGATGTGVFAVATVNLGAVATITASADTGGANLPVSLTLCETDPVAGTCLAPPAATVTTSIAANATPTFGIFATGSAVVPDSPGVNRVFVRFNDTGDVLRGATSVAVRTQ